MIQAEDLPPNYRQNFTEGKVIPLLKLGESFQLEGASGAGKSKYLRYLCSTPEINEKYFKKEKIKLFYIDLNKVYKNDSENVLEVISDTIECSDNSYKGVENAIQDLLTEYTKIYFIFDHGEKFDKCPESTIRLIRSLRDQYKYKLAFILSTEKGAVDDPGKLKYLFGISRIKIDLPLLSNDEMIESIKYYANSKDINLTNEQIEEIADKSNGAPRRMRELLIYAVMGMSIEEGAKEIDEQESYKKEIIAEKPIVLPGNTDEDEILEKALKGMTKSEHLVFKTMYTKRGTVITRDEFAELLNPEYKGEGVSNESIDQLLSRVRKSIKKLDIPIEIKTKHGIGYYIE